LKEGEEKKEGEGEEKKEGEEEKKEELFEINPFDPNFYNPVAAAKAAADASMNAIPGQGPAWDGAAALLCIYINSKETADADKEIWLNARIGPDDKEELAEAQKATGDYAVIFPGLSIWNADSTPVAGEKGADETDIAFKAQGIKYAEIEGKFVISRLFGKITAQNDEGTEITLEKHDQHTETIKEFTEASAKWAAAAATDAATPAEDKKEGEGEEKKEGEEEKKDAE